LSAVCLTKSDTSRRTGHLFARFLFARAFIRGFLWVPKNRYTNVGSRAISESAGQVGTAGTSDSPGGRRRIGKVFRAPWYARHPVLLPFTLFHRPHRPFVVDRTRVGITTGLTYARVFIFVLLFAPPLKSALPDGRTIPAFARACKYKGHVSGKYRGIRARACVFK